MKKPHLYIATPMYGGQCTGFYTQSLLQSVVVFNQAGIDMSFTCVHNESLIQRARNTLAHHFLKTECTHLMFIDADIRFNPNDIVHMVRADVPVLCGIYPKKEINWHGVHHAASKGVPADALRNFTASMVVNLVGDVKEITVQSDKPVEIEHGGTGFMLIKREVLEHLSGIVPKYVNDVNDLGGMMAPQEEVAELFPVGISPKSRRLLSEDYAFCSIARENGHKVYAAPWAVLGHYGSYLFEGRLVPAE